MYPLLLPIAFAISLIIMLSIVIFSTVKSIKRAHRPYSMEWLKQHGKRVIATVLQVTAEGEWKYGGRYSRWNAWEGRFEQERVWQTANYVIAQWQDPQTKQVYTFRVRIDSSAVTEKYIQGHSLPVIFNPTHPEQCYIELQSAASK
jgi:hypothetical protein